MHPTVAELYSQLTLPVISAPMFIVSGPELVIAQCASGIVGSMPALNARPQEQLSPWLTQIETALTELRQREPDRRIAPYAINLIIHRSNDRVDADLAVCAEHKVPIIITSLSAPHSVVDAVHGWGGKVFHDITTLRHAEKALEAGVDGLILVCAGAGGHAGTLSPFALVGEIRKMFDGPIILSGAISRGQDIAAARAMGADFAYIGTRFIASDESNAKEAYKQAIVDASAKDVLYTPYFTGIPGNYLKASIAAAGLDPDNLPAVDPSSANFGSTRSKPWKDIWGVGQGVGNIERVLSVADIVDQLKREYVATVHSLNDKFI
ncbi:nitronate monooxygenase family protein [Pusillimonas sp. ANT_WB101]|uniref:NAD(P)H-dependent flavin oxidoreductase n=1 Tax=Pusillimonas sp. ANT_WB101 TaxID=2597356 RepID=UPI0011ED5869|nr:nitronate monooxygenase family protein [Pusillimonas sp. ANT_WB101]KAA0911228.1 nitronate monooxygenase [Pusillimonas sp. ANT_WB101]